MSGIQPYESTKGRRYRVRYKRPDGRWTSKRGFARKSDAQAWLDSQRTAVRSGEWVDPQRGKVTVGELGEAWLDRKKHLAASTQRALRISWEKHVKQRWGGVQLAHVHGPDIQTWVSGMTCSPTTAIRALDVLRGVLDDAVAEKRIPTNPGAGVRRPKKVRKPNRYLTADELQRLADKAGEHRTFVLILGRLGLRWGEAAALRVSDYSPPFRRLVVARSASRIGADVIEGPTKGRKVRTLTVPESLAAMLDAAVAGRGPSELIFPGPKGHMTIPNHERNWFQGARRRAGLERLTPHDLRHTAASLAVQAGANVKVLQRMLGHESAAVTLDRYAGLFDTDMAQLAHRLDEHWPNLGQPGADQPSTANKNSPSPGG
ncbi:tyrosine-type recombinase/integrase [Epidermidibacterium keratini]|uniref:Tyrosine-type recombinase/integrase n=1 Tax=Epidermidibacterium keratini TaxID=1891644 RepID=A0A7L4YK30_9ACTN|nr:site-specific integrase [Epidermidibacterium keratini]QHB99441.1 tyrosine-type recombinase/integrase [Epidermidibacterium keratini]